MRFLQKAFHPLEIERFRELTSTSQSTQASQYLASRWAAKEAFYKAVSNVPLRFSNILVSKQEKKPCVILTAEPTLEQLGIERALISISHESDHAVAFVFLEEKQ